MEYARFTKLSRAALLFSVLFSAGVSYAGIFGAPAQPAVRAVRTNLSECELTDSSEIRGRNGTVIHHATKACQGVGAFTLNISSRETVSWPSFEAAGTESEMIVAMLSSELAQPIHVSGNVVEWRVHNSTDRAGMPFAAILQIEGAPMRDHPTRALLVVKLEETRACPLATIPVRNGDVRGAVAMARKKADLNRGQKVCR